MELKQQLLQLHKRVDGLKGKITTEEATKNAFIMPFIQILGYDIFNPIEVIPEFTSDIGTKKGEKVDYAIMRDSQPIIIIECKFWKEKLDSHNSQIHRYFNVTKSRFAILTNGIDYEFYTDLEKANVMDHNPFLQINLNELKDININELSKFHKSNFDLDNILNSANSLKYIKAIRNEFEQELDNPSDSFIKLLVSRFYDGMFTSKRLDSFREYTKKAVKTSIDDLINTRLKSVLTKEEETQENVLEEKVESKTITTEEEMEGFRIVVAILRCKISKERIVHRDTQSYFGILLDDNNRKPICRLHLDGKIKKIKIFFKKTPAEKFNIDTIDDINDYSELLLKAAMSY